jgi:hypothetical protein
MTPAPVALRLALLVATALALAGCEQHLAERDTISPFAGSAVAYNKAMHIIDPAPRYGVASSRTSGARIESTMVRYRVGLTPAGRGAGAAPAAIPIAPALAPAPTR